MRGRGIVLIGILVLTLLATFFVGALLQLNPTRLRRTVQDEKHDNAAAAARAGVEYALGRLADDMTWKGQGNRVMVQSENLVVREDRGNVSGWVRADQGDWAAFRLRFNYQDGDGGADGLDQPAQIMPTEAISFNNLKGESPVAIPLGTGPDYSYGGQDGFLVPEKTVALVVEGLVGPGIDPDSNASWPAEGNAGQTTIRAVEGIYQVTGFSAGVPDGAVLQAGGDTSFVLGNGSAPTGPTNDDDFAGFLRLMASEQTAIMRTKGTSTIGQAQGKNSPFNFYPDQFADVRVGKTGFRPVTKAGQEFTNSVEAPNAALMEIEWDKVSQSKQEDRLKLPAGVYTVSGGDSDTNDEKRVGYLPMTFAEYRAKLAAGETVVPGEVPEAFMNCVGLNQGQGVAADGTPDKRDLITFDRDIEVVKVGNIQDFTVVPVSGAKQKSQSDQTATVPPTRFATLADSDKIATGQAIADYLKTASGQSDLSFSVGGAPYFVGAGGLETGSPLELATALMTPGTAITLPDGVVIQGIRGVPQAPGPALLQAALPQPAIVPIVPPVGPTKILINPINAAAAAAAGPNDVAIEDVNAFMAAVQQDTGDVPDTVIEENVDPLEVPASALEDKTVPQDMEIRFAPNDGKSATIRTSGNVMLGAHISGKGGAIVAGGRIDLIGLGLNLQASQGERDGVSLYAKKDINISTYDEKRNKFWDASIKGVIFTKGNLNVRLGESVSGPKAQEPGWGSFDFLGSAIVLGSESSTPIVIGNPLEPLTQPVETGDSLTSGEGNLNSYSQQSSVVGAPATGNAMMIAKGIRLFYDPKFLAPYVEATKLVPIFGTVSVLEK